VSAAPALDRRAALATSAVLVLALLAAGAWALSGPGLLKPNGEPVLADFGIFHTAGRLGVDAYDWRVVTAAYQAFFGVAVGGVSWNYPPPLLLPMSALAGLPYLAAAALWLAGGLAAYAAAIRLAAPGKLFLLAALAYPGTITNLASGQTGLWVTAALGAGLALLPRRPVAAGALLAAVALKPSLAVLLPLALLAGGERRALAGFALAGAGLLLVGFAGYGYAGYAGFFANLGVVAGWGDEGLLPLWRIPTVFAQARQVGLGPAAAEALQIVAGVAAAAAVVWCWRRRHPLRAAVLVAAVPLATPYAFDYDLAMLILPVLWLWRDLLVRGARPAESWTVLAAWTVAVIPGAAAQHLPLHPGLPLTVALLLLALRRTAPTEPA